MLLSRFASLSPNGLTGHNASITGSYYSGLTNAGLGAYQQSVITSTGQIVIVGSVSGVPHIMLFSSDGILLKQESLSSVAGFTGPISFYSLTIDSSNNIYLVGSVYNSSSINHGYTVVWKFSISSNTLISTWTRYFLDEYGTSPTFIPVYYKHVAYDNTTGLIYLVGRQPSYISDTSSLKIAVISSAGLLIQDTKCTSLTNYEISDITGVSISSSRITICGTLLVKTASPNPASRGIVYTFSLYSGGVETWTAVNSGIMVPDGNSTSSTAENVSFTDCKSTATIDYMVGSATLTGSSKIGYIISMSGTTINWQKNLSMMEVSNSILLASEGIYVYGTNAGSTSTVCVFLDYSGNVIYTRNLAITGGGTGLTAGSNLRYSIFLYMIGRADVSNGMINALPADGSILGPWTIGSYTYTYTAGSTTTTAGSLVRNPAAIVDVYSNPSYPLTTVTSSFTTSTDVTWVKQNL
jgi:hypothetical protein